MNSKFRILFLLICLVAVAFPLEENDIDTMDPHTNRLKMRRHRKKLNRDHHHKRLHHNRPMRARASYTSAIQNDEDEYDSRTGNSIPMINLTAKVGDTVILTCAINSSYGFNPGVS